MKQDNNFIMKQTIPPNPIAFRVLVVATIFWLSAVIVAMALIVRQSNSPGQAGETPAHWPVKSRIQMAAGQPNLIMFAHPRCPCTRASLGELERLMALCQGRLSAQVWFIQPVGMTEDWTKTDLWRKASAIPGVTVHCDFDGVETRRFSAETSGQTVLYDRNGYLLFQGGITISRGHAGDNPGSSALLALLEKKLQDKIQTPVFGCPLIKIECQQGGVICKP